MNAAQRSIAEQALIDALATVDHDIHLARKLGISPSALSRWDVVPPYRVLAVEAITGVRRERLRPDLYPAEVAP